MIKIVSGFSFPAGSTIALVNLCNQFNRRGYPCVFYGPDRWHLDKCESAGTADFHPEKGDTVIVHHIELFSHADLDRIHERIEQLRTRTGRSSLKDMILKRITGSRRQDGMKLILTCQENDLFPIGRLNLALFDRIHYAHASQVRYQRVKHDHFICPNVVSPLAVSVPKPERAAGVIGFIRKENRTDLAVETALKEGMKTVTLYGYLFDPVYYYGTIEPLTRTYPGRIRFAGFIDNRQKMYDSISDVYCAVSKPWSPIGRECRMTHTRFHGLDVPEEESMTDEQIFAVWKKELGL
jgi:hypothetical protein